MAASLILEEESGIYIPRRRHPHNGYYAGDFSQTLRPASEPRVSYAERYEAPRAWRPRHTDGAYPCGGQLAEDVAVSSAAATLAICTG